MKKVLMMTIAMMMMAIGMVSCSASADDEISETVSRATAKAEFSLIDCTVTAGASVGETTDGNEEKLVCKVLPGGQLMITHKNTVFDEGTSVKFSAQLDGNKLVISETGDYGKSGNYGYYTVAAKVGKLQDGDYVMVVKRNDHVREEFKLTYDSTRASN